MSGHNLKHLAVIELAVLRKQTIESYRLFKEPDDINFIKAIDTELAARQSNDK